MSETKSAPDRETVNIVLFAVWSLLEALQLLVIVVLVFSFIPIKLSPFVATLFPLHQKGVLPEREMLFYRIFVLGAMALQTAGLWIFRRRLKEEQFTPSLVGLTAANLFWLLIQLFCVFKMMIIDPSAWAKYVFYVSLAGALATRVFWPEVRIWAVRFYENVIQSESAINWRRVWDVAFPAFIVLLLFVPDMDKVLARMFYRDQFYHLDAFLMAPAWAYQQGLTLNMDVISPYSTVMPVVFSFLSKLVGGFNYHNVVALFIAATIAYYIVFYALLRRWLGSALLASFGTLLAIKLQMFHWGVSPLIWQFPTATVLRYIFDLPVLWCIWQHIRTAEEKYLWIASAVCGVAAAYIVDTGVYLNMTFVFYLIALYFLSPQKVFVFPRDVFKTAVLVVMPGAIAFFILGLIQGPNVLNPQMYTNMFEHASLFLQGWGSLPMYEGLKDRQFFAFIMGFVIPVVYTWTLVFVGALCVLRQIHWRNFFVVILCVYGLALYHYFVNRSAVSSYYVVCLPFVGVVCYWLDKVIARFGHRVRRSLHCLVFAAMLCAMMTSYLFTYYPNMFNLSGMDWEPEKKFYKEEFNFERDAELIRSLTGPKDRVALISSFETKILMDAGRKPFFYYFPLLESQHMRLPQFRGTYLHTVDRMKKTLGQLEGSKPAYVFIERKLFKRQIHPDYYQYYQTLNILVEYLGAHYTVDQEGKYLVALKRK